MEKYYVWLLQLFGEANPVIHDVIKRYGSAEKAYEAISGGDHELLNEAQVSSLSYITLERAEKVLEYCQKMEFSVVTLGSEEYPELLAEIYNPPVLLFYKGKLSCLKRLTITVVGAREVTPYIGKLCTKVCKDLSAHRVTIVSGMAVGVDFCAHRACILQKRPTVGVLACGIDVDYPHNSKILRERILMCGGAYVSELLPGTPTSRDYFKQRNRILAGLSRGTAVFQASEKSGSLITAAHAVNENRDVFCVPCPDVFDERYVGVVKYLRDGAIPLFNHDDILMYYKGVYI